MTRSSVLLVVVVVMLFPATAKHTTVRIGALFQENQTIYSSAFRAGIRLLNDQSQDVTFLPVVNHVRNVLDVSVKACSIMEGGENDTESGVASVFTVLDSASSDMTLSLCEMVAVPIIQVTSDNRDFLEGKKECTGDCILSPLTIHMHPSSELLNAALLNFVERFNWKTIVVLYTGSEGLTQTKSALNAGFNNVGVEDVVFWPMGDIRRTLKDLRHSVVYKHIIVDIETPLVEEFLTAAYEMDMMTSYHHYMFTSLDLGAISIDRKYTSGGVNITGFRLVNVNSPKSREVLNSEAAARFVEEEVGEDSKKTHLLWAANALIIDSIHMLAEVIQSYVKKDGGFSTLPINCSLNAMYSSWPYGPALVKEFSKVPYTGLTGHINIEDGRRKGFDLELIEFDIDGNIQAVGNWEATQGLNISTSEKRRLKEIQRDLNNRTLVVVVKPEAPFVMATGQNSTAFEGFAMDMLEYLAKELNFTYNVVKVADETNGRRLSNGSWTGMIGMLIKNEADLALGDLTINYERSRVIDFTKPFMNLGISILYKRPEKRGLDFFSFLEPLNMTIWMCVIGAYVTVSLLCFLVARLSPYQWRNLHPCNPESVLLENEFTLLNSFWFTIASLMQQGSEVAPRAPSARLIAGFWYLFTLILISSYTANLAAFLTINRMSTPIQSADDLAKQTSIKYGCQYGESTYRFFEVAQISTYEKMWNFMSQNPNVFVNKSDLGIAKVKSGKYAYLMESIPLRYQLTQHCDLMEVGDELDSKGYGIGLPKNSPFRDLLSKKVLYLSENQTLLNLYTKWWKNPEDVCKSQVPEEFVSASNANQLGLDNLGGVFVFLMGGLVLAIIIAVVEFLINAFVNSKSDREGMCDELQAECRFAMKCWGPADKPVKLLPSSLSRKLIVGDGDMYTQH